MNDLRFREFFDEEAYAKRLSEKRDEAIQKGRLLLEMLQTPGWKIALDLIEKLTDTKRLMLKPDGLASASELTEKWVYISGSIYGVETLLSQIHQTIAAAQVFTKEKAKQEEGGNG